MSKSGKMQKEKIKADAKIKKSLLERTKTKETKKQLKNLKNVEWTELTEEDLY
jgi:hypothetical protein